MEGMLNSILPKLNIETPHFICSIVIGCMLNSLLLINCRLHFTKGPTAVCSTPTASVGEATCSIHAGVPWVGTTPPASSHSKGRKITTTAATTGVAAWGPRTKMPLPLPPPSPERSQSSTWAGCSPTSCWGGTRCLPSCRRVNSGRRAGSPTHSRWKRSSRRDLYRARLECCFYKVGVMLIKHHALEDLNASRAAVQSAPDGEPVPRHILVEKCLFEEICLKCVLKCTVIMMV